VKWQLVWKFDRLRGISPIPRSFVREPGNLWNSDFRSWVFAEDAKFGVAKDATGRDVIDNNKWVLRMSIDGWDPGGVEEHEVDGAHDEGQQVIRLTIEEDRPRERR